MKEQVQALLSFATVVETGSFTAAAESLGVTRSAVSKQVAGLETALGVRLLTRTTRSLSLTDVGTQVYACCQRIAVDVERAFEVAQASRNLIAGRVRVTAPLSLGRRYLMPLSGQLLARHPHLELDLQLTDAYVDIVRDRIDLAVRVGNPGAASLIARRLAPAPLVVCGAPDYFAQHGRPTGPEELSNHTWVMHPDLDQDVETFQRGRRTVEVTFRGRLASSDGPATVSAAVAGAGMIIAPEFELADEVRSGALERVVPEWQGRSMDVYMVLPSRRHVPSRVRAVETFLREQLSKAPWALT